MRVLFLKGLSAWALGGDRTETLRLVRGAADHGCTVALAADMLPKELAGVEHFKIDYPQTPAVESQVREALAAFRPDVVHVVGAGVRFLETFDHALRGVKWTFTAHNVPPAERTFSRFFGHPRLYYATRNALAIPSVALWSRFLKRGSFGGVICHSETVARRLRARGCTPGKIVDIPFGCDEPTIGANAASPFPTGAAPKILTIAGFAPHKGQFDAVRAVARLLPDFPALAYRMIGNPRPNERYARFIQNEIRRLGLSDHAAILEDAKEPTKHAALLDADVYLQPSHEEGFCIAFMEAAMVVPRLVGTDTGAMRAIAEGDATAKVVRTGDVSGLADAVRALWSNSSTAGAVDARRAVLRRRYSWTTYVVQHVSAYEALLRGG